MFAEYFIAKTFPGKRGEVLEIVDEAAVLLKSKKGFVSSVLLCNEDKNEYGHLDLWETKEDFYAYLDSIPKDLAKQVSSLFAELPVRHTYEVYGQI